MDAFKIIQEDLKAVVRRGLSFNIIQNPKVSGEFFHNKNIISSRYNFFSNEQDYISNYVKCYEAGDYIFAMYDGGFFQINYEFNNVKRKSFLKKLNLCYLPPVDGQILTKDYIRVDYQEHDSHFFHSNAHLHFGFKKCLRLPVERALFFSQFFNLILYCFYVDEFKLYNSSKLSTSHTIVPISNGLTRQSVLSVELQSFIFIKTYA